MSQLTEAQICRQDLVNGHIQSMIHKCLENFFSQGDCYTKHDTEITEDIRNIVWTYIEKYNLPIEKQEFYPNPIE